MKQRLSLRVNSSQILNTLPKFYGTWRFITTFTRVCDLSLSSIQFIHPYSISQRSMLILSSLHLGPPSGLYPSGFPTKTQYVPLFPPTHTLQAPPMSFFLIWSHKQKHRPWSSSLCVSYIPLLPRPFQTQISSSTPYSETPSAYVPSWMWETKFHTHMKQQEKLQVCVF